MPTYSLQERFSTFQGEGVYLGQAAYFLRFMGCNMRCHFCDSAGTWHKDWLAKAPFKGNETEIAGLVPDLPEGTFIVLTGGEPCLYNLEPLIELLHQRELLVHLETAGHCKIPMNIDWVTLSPKVPYAHPPLTESVKVADEFKIIVEHADSISDNLKAIEARDSFAPVWLHPEWGHRNDAEVLTLITETVKANPMFRAGWQLHKNYRADNLDPNASKVLVPLGGVGGSSQ